jgi:hypothetical protein
MVVWDERRGCKEIGVGSTGKSMKIVAAHAKIVGQRSIAMTLQVSIQPELEQKLREQVKAAGTDLDSFVREAIEEKIALTSASVDPSKLTPDERRRLWQEWVEETTEIVKKTLPPGHFVDDSRESIYEDRA